MRTIKKILGAIQRPLLTAFIAVFVVGGVAFAQTSFTQPATTPPGGNVAAPVNVGAAFQQKVGQLWAKSMGTDDGYCIGNSCITAWPKQDPLATCQVCVSIVADLGPGNNSKSRQCSGGYANGGTPYPGDTVTCVPIDKWTAPYRDNTDDRAGGCSVSWKLDCTAPYGDVPIPPPPYTGGNYDGGGVGDSGGGGGTEPVQVQTF